jgi:hypothetical protein
MESNSTILMKSIKANQSIEYDQLIPVIYTFSTINMVIFASSLIFNTLSVISILSFKKLTPINILVLNLAIADFIYTLGIPLFLAQMFHHNWPYGITGCRMFIFTDFIGIIVSVNTVAALSVERYIEIADTKKRLEIYSNKYKILTVSLCMLFVWTIAIAVSTLMILNMRLDISDSGEKCDTIWSDLILELFFSIKFLFIFLLPYVVIIVSSFKLLMFLHKWRSSRLERQSIKLKSQPLYTEISHHLDVSTAIPTSSSYMSGSNYELSNSLTINEYKLDHHHHHHHNHHHHNHHHHHHINNTFNNNNNNNNPNLLSPLKHNEQNSLSNECSLAHTNNHREHNNKLKPQNLQQTSCSFKYILDCLNDLFGFNKCCSFNSNCSKFKSCFEYSQHQTDSIRFKASRLVLAIVVLFLIQWSPLWIFQLVTLFSKEPIKNIQLINLLISTLSYSNTVANPVMYMLITYNFKQSIKAAFFNDSLKCILGARLESNK